MFVVFVVYYGQRQRTKFTDITHTQAHTLYLVSNFFKLDAIFLIAFFWAETGWLGIQMMIGLYLEY